MALDTTRCTPDLVDLDPADVAAEYARRDLDRLSDAALVELVAASVSRPKRAPADSFVLHAPLELLARSALLPLVEPSARDRARQRLAWLGATYQAVGPEVPDDPGPRPEADDDPASLRRRLADAVDAGELDQADAAVTALAAVLGPNELVAAMTDLVLPRLSAAAHGTIWLYQLPRIAPRSRILATSARGLVRELARQPEWVLHWPTDRPSAPGIEAAGRPSGPPSGPPSGRPAGRPADQLAGGVSDLVAALVGPASPGDPGSPFIYPTMSLVDRSGLAAELLDRPTRTTDVHRARRDLLRLAAWSMVQDDPDHAPYGWTHCLTLPQAALGVADRAADPSMAVAVAATYVLGFRATLGGVVLDPAWAPSEPDPADRDPLAALDADPARAAAAVWHADLADRPRIVARLASRAAAHPDAHLAKYTLACFDAAHADPAASRLYLAAAAFLVAWWAARPVTGDPLAD